MDIFLERHDQRSQERSQELPDFDRSKLSVLRGLAKNPVTQLHYAKKKESLLQKWNLWQFVKT